MKHPILGAVALLLCACTGHSPKGGAEAKPLITVTMEPQRYFAQAIAGERFDVVSMVPKGTSPETYDPVPEQLVALGDSKAYLRIGHIGFELSWMERLLENAPHLQVFDTSKGIDLIYADAHDHGDHHHPGGVEPHVWSSTRNALVIARNTYRALVALDKEGEAYYRPRYEELCHTIERTDSVVRHALATPGADRAFLIYHPALSYFARDYGLRQIAIEEGGKEPSPAQLKRLIDTCRSEGVRVVFVQPEFDRRNAEIIAQQTNTRVVLINPLSYDWAEELVTIAEELAQ